MAADVLTARPAAAGAAPRGMTLIEIMIALTILATVLLGMGQFAFNFSRVERQSEARTIAVNLAEARLSAVRASPNYSGLSANFAATETSITGFPGFTRVTAVTHTGGALPTYTNDYTTITVTVTGPPLKTPVTKTIVVAAP